jgi:hypothetical protein
MERASGVRRDRLVAFFHGLTAHLANIEMLRLLDRYAKAFGTIRI